LNEPTFHFSPTFLDFLLPTHSPACDVSSSWLREVVQDAVSQNAVYLGREVDGAKSNQSDGGATEAKRCWWQPRITLTLTPGGRRVRVTRRRPLLRVTRDA